MPENTASSIEEENPARRVEAGKENEERNVEKPQALRDEPYAAYLHGKLAERDGQNASAHGGGEPVGRELPDDFPRTGKMGKWF